MDSLVEQLLDAPQVRLYLAQVQAVLQDEERQRQHFYATLREDQKAEFINGAIIVHSPVKFRHNEASLDLATLLHAYVSTHQIGVVTHEKVLVTLTRNDYEPDIAFFGAATAASFTPDQLHFPAPDAGFAIPIRAIFDRHEHTATLRRILQADA
jgi:Uma2 family endonuclease